HYSSHTFLIFFFNAPATTAIYTLSLHDALPISRGAAVPRAGAAPPAAAPCSLRCRTWSHSRLGLTHRGKNNTARAAVARHRRLQDRKSTRLNSSHVAISYAVFCLKKKKKQQKI